jgi:hypothetical protein
LLQISIFEDYDGIPSNEFEVNHGSVSIEKNNNGQFVYNITHSGYLKVVVSGGGLSAEEIVKSDCLPPPAPEMSYDWQSVTAYSPFRAHFKLVADGHTSIDAERSYYIYKNLDGIEQFRYGIPAFSIGIIRETASEIAMRGVLTFVLYDFLGNVAEYDFDYDLYRGIITPQPIVEITPTSGYTQALTVSMSWGASFDTQPEFPREYETEALGGQVQKFNYTEPFEITDVNIVSLRVYYYPAEGVKTSVLISNILGRIDKTPPQIVGELIYDIDITKSQSAVVRIRATDALSGIKQIILSGSGFSDRLFTDNANGDYVCDITNITSFYIQIKDNADNIRTVNVTEVPFNHALLTKYVAIYNGVVRDDYSDEGLIALDNAFSALSDAISANAEDLTLRVNNVDNAVTGKLFVLSAMETIPKGLSGAFTYEVNSSSFNAKKGTLIRLVFADTQNSAMNGAGKNETLYGFNLHVTDKGGNAVEIDGGFMLTVPLPKGTVNPKVYSANGEGERREIPYAVEGDSVTFKVTAPGTFIISGETKYGLSKDQWTLIGVGIGSTVLLGVGILIIVIAKRRK